MECITKEVWEAVQPEPQQKILEEMEEELQPGTLEVSVSQDLPLLAKGAGVEGSP